MLNSSSVFKPKRKKKKDNIDSFYRQQKFPVMTWQIQEDILEQ